MSFIKLKRSLISLSSKVLYIFFSRFISNIKLNNYENIVILCKGESTKLLSKKKLKFRNNDNFLSILCNFKGNDFAQCKEYKFIKSKPIIIFANASEPVLNLNNLIDSKIAAVYIQRFGTKKNLGSTRNIYEVRSVKKLDRISNDVKYLPPEVSQKMNYIRNKIKKKFAFNTGLASILLALSLKPKKIKIFGLDFYQTNYFNKPLRENMSKKEELTLTNSSFKYISVFLEIVKNNKDVNFEIYTLSDIRSQLKNLKILKK